MEEEKNYAKEYSEESFWEKVKKFAIKAGKEVIEKSLVLYYCLIDKDTPTKAKIVIRAVIPPALGYFIWPLDVIPDLKPVVGFSDDLGVLVMATAVVVSHIKKEHRKKAKEKLEELFG